MAIVNQTASFIPFLIHQLHADVEAADNQGNTAMHWAALKNDQDAALRLMEAKADFQKANAAGDTPLHLAAAEGSFPITQMFVFYGASLTATNAKGQTPKMAALSRGRRSLAQMLVCRSSIRLGLVYSCVCVVMGLVDAAALPFHGEN